MKRKLSPRALFAAVIGGVLVYALVFWFVLVSPKRAEASELTDEVAALEVTVATARAAATPPEQRRHAADRGRRHLPVWPRRCHPCRTCRASCSSSTASRRRPASSSSRLRRATSAVVGDFQTVPIALSFDGNFYELSDFLFRVRTLVGVRSGELRAAGRLFSVDTISFAESPKGFPDLAASLSVIAYVYGSDVPASAGAPAEAPADAPATPAPAPDPDAPAPDPAAAPTGAEASP